MDILGIRLDNLSKSEILEKVSFFLSEEKFHQIATVNPEFILEAQENEEFKDVLNGCDLNIADGFGIRLAFWRHGKNLRCRLTGADLLFHILEIANKKNLSVFLAVKKGGLSSWQEVREAILRRYPNLKISDADLDIRDVVSIKGGEVPISGKTILEFGENPLSSLQSAKTDIILCNFGAPEQELFLFSQKSDRIKLAMGVGGSFDFLTGKVRRAPKIFRFLGLEWLWRLGYPQEWRYKKERIQRIFRAVIIFPIKLIFSKKYEFKN